MRALIEKCFDDHQKALEKSRALYPVIEDMAKICEKALRSGHKILICGNGGSAADAQHIAAEFVGRFHNERRSLPAIALTTDTSILTAVGNDYSFDRVFSRQVEGLGEPGDVLWGISTSGNSPDVLEALKIAREKGLTTIGSTGKTGGAWYSGAMPLWWCPTMSPPAFRRSTCSRRISSARSSMRWTGRNDGHQKKSGLF